jgi:hypothetical protein
MASPECRRIRVIDTRPIRSAPLAALAGEKQAATQSDVNFLPGNPIQSKDVQPSKELNHPARSLPSRSLEV